MRIWTFLLVMLISTLVIGQKETRDLPDYSGVKVSGGIKLNLYSGASKAEINVIKGDLASLETEVKKGILHIKFGKKSWSWNNGGQKAEIDLYGAQNINSLDATAGSSVSSNTVIRTDKLNVQASSGAHAQVEVEVSFLSGNASSGGHLELEGESEKVNLKASSGGHLNAKDLESEVASAKASSGGSVKLWVTKELTAGAGSGGNVSYKGNPSKKNIDVGKYSGGSVSSM